MLATRSDSLARRLDENTLIRGQELAFFETLDQTISTAALAVGVQDWRFDPLIPLETLERAGYLSAFPHLVTQPVAMLPNCDCGSNHKSTGHALIPAACLPIYQSLEGTDLVAPALITTRNTCWRNEASFEPLKRQWAFSMREVVCVGSQQEIDTFLATWCDYATALARGLGLDIALTPATDPFFGVAAAQRLYQAVSEAKKELTLDGLAIASINRHGTHFARAFNLKRNGSIAQSACVAFGLERWLAGLRDRYGDDRTDWPAIPPLQVRKGQANE